MRIPFLETTFPISWNISFVPIDLLYLIMVYSKECIKNITNSPDNRHTSVYVCIGLTKIVSDSTFYIFLTYCFWNDEKRTQLLKWLFLAPTKYWEKNDLPLYGKQREATLPSLGISVGIRICRNFYLNWKRSRDINKREYRNIGATSNVNAHKIFL